MALQRWFVYKACDNVQVTEGQDYTAAMSEEDPNVLVLSSSFDFHHEDMLSLYLIADRCACSKPPPPLLSSWCFCGWGTMVAARQGPWVQLDLAVSKVWKVDPQVCGCSLGFCSGTVSTSPVTRSWTGCQQQKRRTGLHPRVSAGTAQPDSLTALVPVCSGHQQGSHSRFCHGLAVQARRSPALFFCPLVMRIR